ncbi:hypothetical protein GIB67_004602 [Kingdonia uniflora]|uniref:Uncharacterized protein n=1 Tax=Kingdonia uniflora TaxID=39325 RepID=A0A7J7MCZ7_9MAGN|nr:hypothetical protein GIB67_004602 [Kingdonia uniflora]
MNEHGERLQCYFHPKEVLVGVCAFCLKERLLILASKQRHPTFSKDAKSSSSSSLSFSKIFALRSFLHRLQFRHTKHEEYPDHDTASTSQEDSFISIKFEDNGVASWDKKSKVLVKPIKKSVNHTLNKDSKTVKSTVVEHVTMHEGLQWRKRIGQLFQVIRRKKSTKANVGSKVGGVKVRKGWMRSLTKRRTME